MAPLEHLIYGLGVIHVVVIPSTKDTDGNIIDNSISTYIPCMKLNVNLTEHENDVLNDKKNKKYSQDKRNQVLNVVNERLIKKLEKNGIHSYYDIQNSLTKFTKELNDFFCERDDKNKHLFIIRSHEAYEVGVKLKN